MKKKRKRFKRFVSDFDVRDKLILRDFLAMERTTLANERTFFAYIRSGIYLSLTGVAILKLEHFKSVNWIAYALFVISFALLVFGVIRYQLLQRKINRFYEAVHSEQDEEILQEVIEKDKSEE